MADCSWHGQDGNAHNHRPSPQHHLPVHCPCRKRLRPEWPEPHLGARQNARSVCTSLTPNKTWPSSCFGSSALRRSGCVCFLQMWTLQVREWTTGRSRGSWERWPSSWWFPQCWQQLPSECLGLWVAPLWSFRKGVLEGSVTIRELEMYSFTLCPSLLYFIFLNFPLFPLNSSRLTVSLSSSRATVSSTGPAGDPGSSRTSTRPPNAARS